VNDKSASGNNAIQNTATNKPTIVTNAFNGKDALLLNGSDNYMTMNAALLPTGGAARSIFIVSQSTQTAQRGVFAYGTDTSRTRFTVQSSTIDTRASFGGTNRGNSGLSSITAVKVESFHSPIGGAVDSIGMYRNGVDVIPTGGSGILNTASSGGLLGAFTGVQLFFDGYICEVIVYERDLPSNERDQVTNYLIDKWGIETPAPDDISNLKLWIDPSDSGTITESANKVSQINDKSGNGNHAVQGTSSFQPLTSTNTINGLNTLTFDGLDDRMNIPNTGIANTYSFFAVVNSLNSSGGVRGYIFGRGGASPQYDGIGRLGSADFPVDRFFVFNATQIVSKDSPVVLPGVETLYEYSRDNTAISINVADTTPATGTMAVSYVNSSFIIGTRPDILGFTDGYFGEMLLYDKILNATERNLIITYLKNKWGV